ncbi:MAG: T9SS type A sorting domain-containing protein [Bacteroidia bacterium]|nr:T9SS type A sorting domain-containing protein [Bacteroidia bacterium]
MKKILCLFSMLFVFGGKAQVDSVLYGLNISISGPTIAPVSNIHLLRVNTTTGLLSNSANSGSVSGMGIQIGNSTIDPYNKVFYLVGGSNQIIGLDLNTGSLVSSQSLTLSNPGNLFNMYFNCGDTTIYALQTVGMSGVYLAKVNPANGVVTTISQNAVSASLQINNVTIDPYNQVFYYFSQNTIVGVSLSTGTIVSSAPLSVPSSTVSYNYSGIFYDKSDSTLYGLALNPALSSVYLAKFSPSGSVTIISPNSLASGIMVANASLDPYNKIYHFMNGNQQLLGVSLQTGMVLSSPTLTNPAMNNNFFEMNYSCAICPKPKQSGLTGVKENQLADQLTIFPNPANTRLFVKLNTGTNYSAEIRDISGRLILIQNGANTNAFEIDLAQFKKGSYTLTVVMPDQKPINKKLIIAE